MSIQRLGAALCVAIVSSAAAAFAKEEDAKKWDVSAPPMETRKIALDVDEGTWMNVDVSPDGRLIAFDLLGDIYVMPIAGGTPRRIADGLAFDMQPRFSPDGKRIAFTSDRGGGDNLWIMNADGADKRAVTKEKFRLLSSPDWSPDGRFLIGRKHFTTTRSLGAGEVWLYHLGGGDGAALVKKPSDTHQKELGEPAYSPDGRFIYYSRNTTPGERFEYAQDSNAQVFAIERYDIAKDETTRIVGGAGGAVRPTPSPDGRKLAFVKRVRGKSALFALDLATGAQTKLYDALDRDLQETWAVHGVYPTMDWTPDGQSLVFWAGGKIRRVTLAGVASEIPFRVSDDRIVIDPPRPVVDVAPSSVTAKMARHVSFAPDGRMAVFESLGKLWSVSRGGAPRRLTSGAQFDFFPSLSRDGKSIVYVSWTDDGLGQIRIVGAGGGSGRVVTSTPGVYRRPRLSPDGRTIVFEKGAGGYLLSDRYAQSPGVYRVPVGGGAMTRISEEGVNPHFGAQNDRVYMTVSEDKKQKLVSVNLDGGDRRVHASGDLVVGYEISPDGRHVAYRDNYAAYVMPVTPGGHDIAAGAAATAMPVTKASAGGVSSLSWANAGALGWSLGAEGYIAQLSDIMPSLPPPEDAKDAKKYTAPAAAFSFAASAPARIETGVLAFVGARIITMAGNDGGVIEDGVIITERGRIRAIGPRAGIAVPAGAKVMDVAGKTITPGFVDAHAHGPAGDDDIIPQQNWSAMAHLALGVTTIHDPSNQASEIFAAADMQRAGLIVGPRMFSTGEIVYGAKAPGIFADIASYDDALAHVRRLKAQGGGSVKNYNQPRRDQRQQVVAAAKAENMGSVAEGGSLFAMDMTIIADGNTALEHNIPQAVLYEDVLSFFAQTKVAYTPTLVVTYGGLAADPYWRFKTDVFAHPILSKLVPPHVLQPKSVRATKAPEEDFADTASAASAKALADRGVLVSIGAHGQQEGLAAHWEMWSFAKGGMTPLEALRTATTAPARHLGMDRDIGSLEVGKLADFVVLNADPLADIRNSDDIDMVVQGGRAFDAATMNVAAPAPATRQKFYWE